MEGFFIMFSYRNSFHVQLREGFSVIQNRVFCIEIESLYSPLVGAQKGPIG